MATSNSHVTNEIIITAMDRFVWFVLLVVMSHLVTEFTRVTGFARSNSRSGNEANPLNYIGIMPQQQMINDSQLIQGKQVQSLVFFPAQEYTGTAYYPGAQPPPRQQQQQQSQQIPLHQLQMNGNLVLPTPTDDQTIPTRTNMGSFNLRPLIDSIFEIPLSTLRAVNNLVARLTGGYQHQSATPSLIGKTRAATEKRATNGILLAALAGAQNNNGDTIGASKTTVHKSTPSSRNGV